MMANERLKKVVIMMQIMKEEKEMLAKPDMKSRRR
jgi:hypothetical protein